MARLAETMRPTAAQPEQLCGPASQLWQRQLRIWRDHQKFHIVFWGPPGAGKTTLARMLAEASGLESVYLSAVQDGVSDIRQAVQKNPGGILFIDEIHRMSRSQQDVLLPILEHDQCWVVGATTESPQAVFAPALLSRLRLLQVGAPQGRDIEKALIQGMSRLSEGELSEGFSVPVLLQAFEDHRPRIIKVASGDLRLAWNILESLAGCYAQVAEGPERERECAAIFSNLQRSFTLGSHYDYVSAMIKSMRGSDPDAALYYAVAALDAGEDVVFLLRRCVIFASEDIGNADPQALGIAVHALHAAQAVGMPEARIPLAQAVTYLAATLKSNRSYRAIEMVRSWRETVVATEGQQGLVPPNPLILKGASEYRYPHDYPGGFVQEEYLPRAAARLRTNQGVAYSPNGEGVEARILDRLSKLWPGRYSDKTE